METEVKILVYRDRTKKETAQKQNRLNRRLAAIAAALVVILTAGAVVMAAGIRKNSNTIENTVAEVSVAGNIVLNQAFTDISAQNAHGLQYSAEYAEYAKAELPLLVNRQKVELAKANQNRGTLVTGDNFDYASLDLNENFEDNIILMLLADLTGEEEDEFLYIPATMGRQTEDDIAAEGRISDENNAGITDDSDDILAFESTITAESDSRLEAVAEIAALLTGPEDAPKELNYNYNPDIMLELSARETEVLERIVEAEATGMSVYGKILVANVVINRVNSRYFANDVESVVFQKLGGSYQFAPIKDGRYYSVEVTDLSREAVARALAGEDYSEGALYFFERSATSKSKATWFDKNLKFLFKYGAHEFFTEYKK